MVAIQGKLEEASLPDVLQLLALGKKTGCLALTDGVLQGNIYLDTGRITYAAVANRRDRLGDMLIKSGRITREQLAEAIGQQSAGHKRLGEILVASGRVARAELERFAQVQVEEAVYFLFTWRKGTFTFESNARPEGQDFLASINPEGLLLEGARRIDEWSLIEKKIPSFDMVFRVDRARLSASDVTLTEEQRRIVPLLDGQHDVHAVVEATALAEFDVGKALYGLVSAGFAQLVERRATVRHLDYRELLAYLVHEAEFADPERRKQATRHIVDCKLCAPRLKEIHVRRTQETRADEVAQALAEPARAAPAAAPPALAVLAAPARSSGQRRSGGGKAPRDASGTTDRRRGQRRAADRRRAVAAAPPAGLGERRAGGERRHAERRLQDRLGIALARATTGAAVKGAVPQRTERSRRNTGPRRLTTLAPERRPGAAPSPKPDVTRPAAAESPPEPAVAPAGAVATAATAAASVPTAESQPSASAPAPVRTAPAAKPPAPTGAPGRRGKSREIEWLITPEESGLHPVVRPPTTPRVQPAAAPVAAPPPAPPIPSEEPTLEARPPLAEIVREAKPETKAAPEARPAARPTGRRWLAAAATLVAVAGMGALAMALLRPRAGNGVPVAEAVASPQTATESEAQIGLALPQPVPESPARASAVAPAPSRRDSAVTGREPTRVAAAEPATRRPPPPAAERAAGPERVAVEQRPPVEQRVEPPVTPPARPIEVVAAPAAAPQVTRIRGAVRSAATGAALAGVRVTVAGTGIAAVTDAAGTYELADPPPGAVTVEATLAGHVSRSTGVTVEPGATRMVDFSLEATPAPAPAPAPPPVTAPAPAPAPIAAKPVTALKPDEELAGGRWTQLDAAEAETLLGQPLAVIEGLWVESVARAAGTARPRVRVAQLTPSGERVALVETRSGARATAGDQPRVTALRIMPPSEAYPVTTGTGSFGSLLVTATTALPPDSLRALLGRLVQSFR